MSDATPQPSALEPSAIARSFDATPYRYVQTLGQGGMGTVFEAEHRTLGTRVAVKVLHPELAGRDELADRMRLEAQALARLSHPNVVQVTDLGRTDDGLVYYVMERLVGRTLGAELEARGALPYDESLAIALAALDALAAAHDLGIVHRDVKPENIFLADDGRGGRRVKLLDFGIAKVVAEAGAVPGRPAALAFPTREDVLLGTPHYVAPEQIAQRAVVSPATDVYAMGLVLYRLFCGRHPFAGRPRDAVLRAHLEEQVRRPSALAPVGAALEDAILRALARNPHERPRDARALAALLMDPRVAMAPEHAAPSEAHTAATLAVPRALVRLPPSAEPDASDPQAPPGPQPNAEPAPGVTPSIHSGYADPTRAGVARSAHPTPLDPSAPTSARLVSSAAAPRGIRWAAAPLVLVALGSIVLRAQGVYSVLSQSRNEAALLGAFGEQRETARQILDSVFTATCLRHALLLVCSLGLLATSTWTFLSEGGAPWLRRWSYGALVVVLGAVALDLVLVTPAQLSLATLTEPDPDTVRLTAGLVMATSASFAIAELGSVAYALLVSRGARA
ncbi:MAG: protein kinase [Myxococcales bacterium]|nr:protein kinase [Myxococcales bacterium]